MSERIQQRFKPENRSAKNLATRIESQERGLQAASLSAGFGAYMNRWQGGR
jgi:hypothetical protein